MSFKLVIKNGAKDYKLDTKTGVYKTKIVDDVYTYESFTEALAEFLYSVGDDRSSNKVSLTFIPDKKNKN